MASSNISFTLATDDPAYSSYTTLPANIGCRSNTTTTGGTYRIVCGSALPSRLSAAPGALPAASMRFSLTSPDSEPGCRTKAGMLASRLKRTPGCTDPGALPLYNPAQAGSLTSSAWFKIAPEGSGFGSKALLPAGRSLSSCELTALSASRTSTSGGSSTASDKDTAQLRLQHISAGSAYSSALGGGAKRVPPGSLLSVSTLSEALQICPFAGDASAGALLLATAAGFAALQGASGGADEGTGKVAAATGQGRLQAPSHRRAAVQAVHQQIEWQDK